MDTNGRRRPRAGPVKGSPLTLPEIFWWTAIVAGYLLVVVIAFAYVAQSRDPRNVPVCETGWSRAPETAGVTRPPPADRWQR